jgi:hypothetical protein
MLKFHNTLQGMKNQRTERLEHFTSATTYAFREECLMRRLAIRTRRKLHRVKAGSRRLDLCHSLAYCCGMCRHLGWQNKASDTRLLRRMGLAWCCRIASEVRSIVLYNPVGYC